MPSLPPPIQPATPVGRRKLPTLLFGGALILVSALGGAAAFYSNRHLNQKQSQLVTLYRDAAQARRLHIAAE